jgi:hypothetical protein
MLSKCNQGILVQSVAILEDFKQILLNFKPDSLNFILNSKANFENFLKGKLFLISFPTHPYFI